MFQSKAVLHKSHAEQCIGEAKFQCSDARFICIHRRETTGQKENVTTCSGLIKKISDQTPHVGEHPRQTPSQQVPPAATQLTAWRRTSKPLRKKTQLTNQNQYTGEPAARDAPRLGSPRRHRYYIPPASHRSTCYFPTHI